MRRCSVLFAAFLALTPLVPAAADEPEADVFVVRLAGEMGEIQYRHQDLPAALRYLFPVPFSARSGLVQLSADSSSGVSEREIAVLARRPQATLERVAVLFRPPVGKAPRPDRTVSVVFTLDELLAKGGPLSAVPAAWACYKAASACGWTRGLVWARSVVFDARTARFMVKVALSK